MGRSHVEISNISRMMRAVSTNRLPPWPCRPQRSFVPCYSRSNTVLPFLSSVSTSVRSSHTSHSQAVVPGHGSQRRPPQLVLRLDLGTRLLHQSFHHFQMPFLATHLSGVHPNQSFELTSALAPSTGRFNPSRWPFAAAGCIGIVTSLSDQAPNFTIS